MGVRFTGRVVDEGRLMASVLPEILEAEVRVDVGIRDPEVARYAAINEFGTDRIPERSFLRSTLAEGQGRYLRAVTAAVRAVANNRASAQAAFGAVGARVVADVQRKMEALKSPPNAAATIRKKGFDNPLIESGLMRDSVDYTLLRSSPLQPGRFVEIETNVRKSSRRFPDRSPLNPRRRIRRGTDVRGSRRRFGGG